MRKCTGIGMKIMKKKTEEKEGVNDEKYDYWRKLAGKKEIVVIIREELNLDNIT